jgi:hypothetical protein
MSFCLGYDRLAHSIIPFIHQAILEWLETNSTSPITRKPLAADQLFPNRALKDLMESDEEDASIPSAINSSPNASDVDEQDMDDQASLSELASKVSFETTITGDCKATNGLSLLRVQVPDDPSERHLTASIICVIDESYSMDGAAITQEDQEGKSGLSLLDIVKHACKTVIETLGPNDTFAIVSYADYAQVKFPFMKMTPENKSKARLVVESLKTHGSTNLWSGLHEAMELTREVERASDILLLTDGLPNIHPPRGELDTFERYKSKQTFWNCRISTFGFGYNLDSKLLNDIAIQGDGQYCFIPDSSFVGTIFINATSNILSTAINTCILTFDEQNNNPKIQDCNSPSSQFCLSLPSLCYGQSLDVLVNSDIPMGSGKEVIAYTLADIDLEVSRLRSSLVSMIRDAEERFSNKEPEALTLAQRDTQQLIDEMNVAISRFEVINGECQSKLQAMKEDLVGQITEAYSRNDWHSKWGRHYLLSLARAHELQRCTNFKDPGLQVYVTNKFSIIRDIAEDLFCKLPPPKPSRRHHQNSTTYAPVRSMSTYHNVDNGCLAWGNVRMIDGRYISVRHVAPGDVLQSCVGPVKVQCVVTSPCVNGVQALVELDGGVLVTPWHPVRVKGSDAWKFPADIGQIHFYSCDMVYNFVLENGTSLPIGPFDAISLGHGIDDDPVAKHEYFGTSKIIQDLKKMAGWNEGLVQLAPNPGRRDPESGLITSFVQKVTKGKNDPEYRETESNQMVPSQRQLACAN